MRNNNQNWGIKNTMSKEQVKQLLIDLFLFVSVIGTIVIIYLKAD